MIARSVRLSGAILSLLAGCGIVLQAQTAAEPTAYTVKSDSSLTGPTSITVTYRLGSKVVVDSTTPTPAAGVTMRLHTYFDLDSKMSYTWDPANDAVACSAGKLTGDWGDPFGGTQDLMQQGAKQVGAETVNGIPATVYELQMGASGTMRAWLEPKTGMLVKAVLTPPSGPPTTMVDVTSVDLTAPPASVFALPARCTAAPAAASTGEYRMPDVDQRIAEYTGDTATNYEDAIYAPGAKSGSCTVVMRVVKAGTMEPITSGFQIALDMNIANEPAPQYQIGESQDGHVSFSGGGLHEVTAQMQNGVLRIENPPEKFHVETSFGSAGQGSSDLYRQCFGPQTVLLYVLKNPANLVDGTEWLWVRSGKYAAAQ